MSQKIKSMLSFSVALLISASLTGCSLLPAEEKALKPPLVKPAQESYRTVAVEKGTITQEVKGIGNLESMKMEMARFIEQGGRVEEVVVKAGDTVKKGDVLVQLNVEGLDVHLKEQQLSLARAKLSLKQAKLSADQDAISIAQLQMEIEDIKYERLLNVFEKKQLVAGMDGQVTFVEDLENGDIVEAYQTLVIISDQTQLRVALRVDSSSEISSVEVGFPAKVTIGEVEIEGKVVQTPSSSPDTLNEQLKERYSKTLYIELPKVPKDSAIGALADVKIILQQRDNILKIPRSSLRGFLGRTFVRTLEDGNKIREIDVETGIKGSTEIEITKGLEEGAIVVLQ